MHDSASIFVSCDSSPAVCLGVCMCVSVIMIYLLFINIHFIIIPCMFSGCFLTRERKNGEPGGRGSQKKRKILTDWNPHIETYTNTPKTPNNTTEDLIGLVNLSD